MNPPPIRRRILLHNEQLRQSIPLRRRPSFFRDCILYPDILHLTNHFFHTYNLLHQPDTTHEKHSIHGRIFQLLHIFRQGNHPNSNPLHFRLLPALSHSTNWRSLIPKYEGFSIHPPLPAPARSYTMSTSVNSGVSRPIISYFIK